MKMLRIKQVVEKTGAPRGTIYTWMSTGMFPRHARLGLRLAAWLENEIDEFLMSKPCSVCVHRDAEKISAKLVSGVPLAILSKEYGLTSTSMQRHKRHIAYKV